MIVEPLTTKQRAAVALSSQHALTVYEGAVRSSKTVTSLLDWIKFVRTAPPGPLLMVGKTERTLERNVIGPLTDMLGKRRCRFVRGTGELHMLGRVLYVAGANDERSQDKIRGLTLAGAYVDEVSIAPESFWAMLLTRLSVDGARLIGTTNPDSPAHWLKRDYLDRAGAHLTRAGHVEHPNGVYDPAADAAEHGPVDLARLSFVLDDNPTLTAKYRAYLDSIYTGLWRRRYIDGDWVAAEGAIYDALDLDGPNRTEFDTMAALTGRYWLGIDYADSNPFHAVLIGEITTQQLVVVGEWRYSGKHARRQMLQTEYEEALVAWLEAGAGITIRGQPLVRTWPQRVAVDPSAAGFRGLLRRRGWTGLVEPDEKINAVRDGIRDVSALIGTRRLLFAQGAAPELERELLGYVWDAKATAKGEDKPVKVDDHGADALRYAVAAARAVWRPWLSGWDQRDEDAA